MPERPAIESAGVVLAEQIPGRLYRVEMPNGYQAVAVLPKRGPKLPSESDPAGQRVRVAFSPYDMSRCRILEWLGD